MSSTKIYVLKGQAQQSNGIIPTMADNNISPQSNVGINATLKNIGAYQIFNATGNACKQVIDYNLNNYGDLTGDYLTQSKINNAMSLINIGMNIVGTTVSGFAMGGIPGAIAGLGVGLINTGVNMANQMRTLNLNYAKTNQEAAMRMNRLGSILNNGAR